jgi:hypothetical protein
MAPHNKLTVGTIYAPPANDTNWVHQLSNTLELIELNNKPSDITIIAGDFNIHWDKPHLSRTRDLIDVTSGYSIKQIIDQPTFPLSHGIDTRKSMLDLFFTSHPQLVNASLADNLTTSCQHAAIDFSISIGKEYRNYATRQDSPNNTSYLYNPLKNYNTITADFDAISRDLQELDFSDLACQDMDSFFEVWYNSIINIIKQHSPLIHLNRGASGGPPPWFPREVVPLVKLKRKIFADMKEGRRSTPDNYNEISARISKTCVQARIEYVRSIIDSNKTLNGLFKLIKSNRRSSLPTAFIDEKGISITDPIDVADHFGRSFSCESTSHTSTDTHTRLEADTILNDINISMNDILAAIGRIRPNKAVGPYSVPAVVIRNCRNAMARLIFDLFSRITQLASIPSQLKITRLTPVLKKGKKQSQFGSYRPIGVISNIMMLLDDIVNLRIEAYTYSIRWIPMSQYGFSKGSSCEHLVGDLLNEIAMAFNDKSVLAVDMILLDFTNAFGSVNHSGILNSYEDMGIGGRLLDLLKDDLRNRRQFVSYNSITSSCTPINRGIIQGGIKSPNAFKYYVKSLPAVLQHMKIYQYCDDTTVINAIRDTEDIQHTQADLDNLVDWCSRMDLSINGSKSYFIRFSTRRDLRQLPTTYIINGEPVEASDQATLLGIIIDKKLTFDAHCNMRILNASRSWACIKKILWGIDWATLRSIYIVYIRTIIEYGSNIWHPNKGQMTRLESFQRRCTRYLFYKQNPSSIGTHIPYSERLQSLELESLWARFQTNKLHNINKYRIGRNSIFCRQSAEITHHERRGSLFKVPHRRLEFTEKSPLIRAILIFNTLPHHIRQLTTVSSFNAAIKDYLGNAFSDAHS